jgi:hypothetical protein
MLILNLLIPSRSISANEVSLPAIIVVSLDTSGHTVLKSDISSLGSGKQSKRQVSLALNLLSLIMFFGNNGPQRDSPSCYHYGKYGHIKAECFKVKPHKPKKNQTNEGLVNKMKNVLVRLINWDIAHTPASQVKKVWVRKDETIHPLRGVGSPSR